MPQYISDEYMRRRVEDAGAVPLAKAWREFREAQDERVELKHELGLIPMSHPLWAAARTKIAEAEEREAYAVAYIELVKTEWYESRGKS